MGGVFLVQKDGSLVEMEELAYPSEDNLQDLFVKYPNLKKAVAEMKK